MYAAGYVCDTSESHLAPATESSTCLSNNLWAWSSWHICTLVQNLVDPPGFVHVARLGSRAPLSYRLFIIIFHSEGTKMFPSATMTPRNASARLAARRGMTARPAGWDRVLLAQE